MDKEKELITECLKNQTKLIKEQTKVLTNLAIKNQLLKNEIIIYYRNGSISHNALCLPKWRPVEWKFATVRINQLEDAGY